MIISEFFIFLTIENKCFAVFFMVKRTKSQCSASAKKTTLTRKRKLATKKSSKSKKKR